VPKPVPYDPEKVLEVLEQHDPRYTLIAGLGAKLRRPRLVRADDAAPASTGRPLARAVVAVRSYGGRVVSRVRPGPDPR